MANTVRFSALSVFSLLFTGAAFFMPSVVLAHCDTYSGPVVIAAKQALEKGDVTPVLKWVKKQDEEQIRAAFKATMTVRSKGPEAKELADNYFFETLVRIHRAGERAPYTGLKNEPVEPVIAMSDRALETGAVDSLVTTVSAHIKEGIKERFGRALAAKKNADKSIEAGREYVEAYVTYVHYVEGIHAAAMLKGGHHTEGHDGAKTAHEE